MEGCRSPKQNPENPDSKGIEVDHTRTVEGLDETVDRAANDPGREEEQSNVPAETKETSAQFRLRSLLQRIFAAK